MWLPQPGPPDPDPRDLSARSPLSPVEAALLRRGHQVHSMNPWELLLAAPDQAGPAQQEAFYQAMRRYSFRLLLRDVIARRHGFTAAAVQRYASLAVTEYDLQSLCAMGVLKRTGDTFELVNARAASFGETLEWYVAAVLEREFHYATAWSVKLSGESEGCDYDVLATAEGRLLYVETKAAPPRNIHEPQIRGFLDRTRRLGPDLAIFLVDTELRLEDKILVMFRQALPEPLCHQLQPAPQPQALYCLGAGLCITNSRRDLIENLRLALRALYQARWRV